MKYHPSLTLVRATRWDNLLQKRCWLESVQWGDLAGNLHINYRSVYLNSYHVCFFCDMQEQFDCLPYILPGGLDHVLPLPPDGGHQAQAGGHAGYCLICRRDIPVSHHHPWPCSILVPGLHVLGRVSARTKHENWRQFPALSRPTSAQSRLILHQPTRTQALDNYCPLTASFPTNHLARSEMSF